MTESRGKLVEEFDKWYRAAFIGDVEDEKGKVEVRDISGLLYLC